LRKSEGLGPLGYEVGSDRWGYKDIEHMVKLVSLILSGLKRRNLSVDVTFAVGDAGTSVKPGNRLNVNKAIELMNALSKHGILLKVHSADYIENPQDFPSIGIGGANVGPMFTDLIYRRIKELALIESNLKPREASGIINVLLNELSREHGVLKYVSSIEELKSLIGDSREFLLGLMTRYVWSRDAVRHALSILKSNLRSINVDVDKELISIVMNSVKHLMLNFNLQGSLLMLKQLAT
jgi:tagatose-1,6-bisphosphate aldolase non-catalytic subunit AgaZ/GatZ